MFKLISIVIVITVTALYVTYLAIRSVQNTSQTYKALREATSLHNYFKLDTEYVFTYRVYNEEDFKALSKQQIINEIIDSERSYLSELVSKIIMNQKENKRQSEQVNKLTYIGINNKQKSSWVPKSLYRHIEKQLIHYAKKGQVVISPKLIGKIYYRSNETGEAITKDFSLDVQELREELVKKRSKTS